MKVKIIVKIILLETFIELFSKKSKIHKAINITMITNKLMFEFLNFNFTKKFISFNSITSLKIYH
jgi:hypothetical protein